MPSSPKILKETILETAYNMLIQNGYTAINIKTVAQELGCSTQPISRQFGSMDGLREELLQYCLMKFSSAFSIKGEHVTDIVLGVAKGYIDLAYDYPNVYKYLYMSDHEGKQMSDVTHSLRSNNYETVIQMLMKEYEITYESAYDFMKNMEYYVHGIASYIATDYVEIPKEDLMKRIKSVRDALLNLAQGN
ncbi:MAG: TetR/AcrR family transcriptional regulator [Agathobacter sp.]|nr:TetR/AcrR family transcriptional regulator [Agathobacter sp.]